MFCFKSTRRRSCIFGALLFVSSKYHYQLCVSLCNVKKGTVSKIVLLEATHSFFVSTLYHIKSVQQKNVIMSTVGTIIVLLSYRGTRNRECSDKYGTSVSPPAGRTLRLGQIKKKSFCEKSRHCREPLMS